MRIRFAIAAVTLAAMPWCVTSHGLSSGAPVLVRCVPHLRRVPVNGQPWMSLGAPLDSIDYRIFWDAEFQVYEVVFRNRSATPMTLRYVARASADADGTLLNRELGPHSADGAPGASVHGARTGAPACVVVGRVDSGR